MAVVQKRQTGFQISYVTITYRSVALVVLALTALVALVMYFVYPDTSNRVISSGEVSLGKFLARVGLGGGTSPGPEPGPQQAHFINIDGTVRVKKASTNTWVQPIMSYIVSACCMLAWRKSLRRKWWSIFWPWTRQLWHFSGFLTIGRCAWFVWFTG